MKSLLRDEELIKQFLTTSPNDCFEALYSRYVDKVYRRCLSLTKDAEQAQDFTQDIFLRAFARLDRFEHRSSFQRGCTRFPTIIVWISCSLPGETQWWC